MSKNEGVTEQKSRLAMWTEIVESMQSNPSFNGKPKVNGNGKKAVKKESP